MNPIPFIDIHTHCLNKFNNIITVKNINPGENIMLFTGKNFFSVGLHPWNLKSKNKNNEQLQMMREALELDHVIFVGECGLDKSNNNTNFEEQKRVFHAQAFIAEEFQKPLIIHCIKAFNELIEIQKKIEPSMPWILHGFNGSPELTKQLSSKNFIFSFGKLLFNKKAKVINSFLQLPLKKIFFETDEYPNTVEKIYKEGALLKNISIELLKEAIWNNFNKLENISITL